MKKVLSILMIIVLMLSFMNTSVFAAGEGEGKTTGKVDISFMENITPSHTLSTETNAKMQNIGSTILTIVTNAAMILAVVIIAVIGVKYMMGSIEEKAEYKKTMMPYFIGAILVFGAGAIGKMVVGIGSSLI